MQPSFLLPPFSLKLFFWGPSDDASIMKLN
jgi:hypothetical protein